MKERLIQLLDLEQLSPSKFADLIGVQRSSISHIISGRNKPSFDFLTKTLRAFPGLNASWLLLGEGTMYEQMGRKVSGNLFDASPASEGLSEEHISANDPSEDAISPSPETELPPASPEINADPAAPQPERKMEAPGKKQVVQVMVFYDDDTFRTFRPSN
jgi:transcriptional regulator with XRE-family HTH domain